jgi:hypothetical protein
MPTQIGELGVTFPDATLQTTAAVPGGPGFGGAPNTSIYTASGFWICPPSIFKVRVTVVGGGGGSNAEETSGGSGGCAIGVYNVTPGTTYSLTVGAGGNLGAAGGTSSFGSFCSATGGLGAGPSYPYQGQGIGGNIRNSAPGASYMAGGSQGMGPLTGGDMFRLGGSTPITWSISAPHIAGAGGEYSTVSAGVGGAVMIEWWG